MKHGFTTTKAAAEKMVLAVYEGLPCRVCGQTITDAKEDVYVGYSVGDKARSAHRSCWQKNLPKSSWAYPQDAS